MANFEKIEIAKNEPYRFVGKSVYLGNKRGSGELFEGIWKQCDWVFVELENMKEYASDEIHNAVLFTWEKYDDKNELFGYYVGRFMKADTPVTKDIDLDYFDIPGEYIAKAWRKGKFGDKFGNMLVYGEGECKDEIERTGVYSEKGWVWMAEIYTKPNENGESYIGVYIPCVKL